MNNKQKSLELYNQLQASLKLVNEMIEKEEGMTEVFALEIVKENLTECINQLKG